MVEIKHKSFDFKITDTKEIEKNGQKIGVIEGYASTFGIDRVGDQVMPGAFENTINEHKGKSRPVRMLYQHSRGNLLGGFPSGKIKEDNHGLFVVGEINLDVQKGREAYALAKQGVLTDLSIGYSVVKWESVEDKDSERTIYQLTEIKLWEISLVDEPANEDANITGIKAVSFQDLPLADKDSTWSRSDAEKRVRAWAGAEDAPNEKYRKAYVYYDKENTDVFGSCKLLIADVIDGQLKVIPRAIFASASILQGARGGINIPDTDKQRAKTHLSKYYKKLDMTPPWEKGYYDENLHSLKDVEAFLKEYNLTESTTKGIIYKVKDIYKNELKEKGHLVIPDKRDDGDECDIQNLVEKFCQSVDGLKTINI